MAVGSSAPAKPWLPNLWLIRRAHHRGCSRRVRQISASTSADSFVGLVRGQRDRSARTVTLLAADVLRGGDTRWIHRAAHDLMGVNPDATKSMAGMPCGRSLYGSIPEQLADDTSCTRQLQSCGCARITAFATSKQIDIPDVSHRGMLVMVHQLDDPNQFQLTVLNFANEHIAGTVRSKKLPPGARVSDMFTGEEVGVVDDLNSFAMELVPHHGASLLVEQPPDSEA